MENESKNVTLENKIFTTCKNDEGRAIDRNGFVWSKVDDVNTTKSSKPKFSNYYTFVEVEKNERDRCYELYYKGGEVRDFEYDKDRKNKLLGKIDFNWLSVQEKQQINKFTKPEQTIQLVAASADYMFNYTMLRNLYHGNTVEYKYLLFLFITDATVIPLNSPFTEFDVMRSGVLHHTPLLDRLYLRMFFPEIYEREKRIDDKNDFIEQNFYSKREKILWGESLSYIILLALSVVAMAFSLINLMIFIIVASVLTVIFGFGLLYEFKFRKIPYISKLPQEEIAKIKRQVEREKSQNKDQDQNENKDEDQLDENQKDKEKNNNINEINTDSHKENKESLITKMEDINRNNKEQKNGSESNELGTVFSLIKENKNNNEKDETGLKKG